MSSNVATNPDQTLTVHDRTVRIDRWLTARSDLVRFKSTLSCSLLSMTTNHPLRPLSVGLVALSVLAAACGTGGREATPETSTPASSSSARPTTTPGLVLEVGALPDTLAPLAGSFTQHIDVWGISIVATGSTERAKVIHAANVLAQYLDNDGDGAPDDAAVIEAMVTNRATLLMGQTPDDFESLDQDAVFGFVGAGGQDLYASETKPDGGFDASLEEVHHLILNTGWARVFPDELAQIKGSAIADAMDIARGGQFDTIPSPYPDGAWYTYDDETCDYTCMITEYTYWAHTSLLGAQSNRASAIGQEWRLETAAKVQATDRAATAILQNPTLGLPTVLPDGNYQPDA